MYCEAKGDVCKVLKYSLKVFRCGAHCYPNNFFEA